MRRRMKLCDTPLTSLKHNRRYNSGDDKQHNGSIIKYVETDNLVKSKKYSFLLTIQEHADWEAVIGKQTYISVIRYSCHSLLSVWTISKKKKLHFKVYLD